MSEEEEHHDLAPKSLTKDALKPKPLEEDGASEEKAFAPFTMPEFPIFPSSGQTKPATYVPKPSSSLDAPPRKTSQHIIHVEIDSSLVPLKEASPGPVPEQEIPVVKAAPPAPAKVIEAVPEVVNKEQVVPKGKPSGVPKSDSPSPVRQEQDAGEQPSFLEKWLGGASSSGEQASLLDAVRKNVLWMSLLSIPPLILLVLMTVPGFLFYTKEHQGFYYFSKSLANGMVRWIAIGFAVLCVFCVFMLPVITLKRMRSAVDQSRRPKRRKRRL